MQNDKAPLCKNIGRTLLLSFLGGFLVIMPVAVPFFQSKGLSMQEVFTLQALFGLVVMITEVPSGYVADLIRRKWTLVAGAAFLGLGHSLLLNAQGFWTLAMFETALGIGHSLNSRVPSEFRATANSMASFGFRGAFMVIGPLVGLWFDLWGMSATLLALAVVSRVIFAGLIVPLIFAARELAARAPG